MALGDSLMTNCSDETRSSGFDQEGKKAMLCAAGVDVIREQRVTGLCGQDCVCSQ